MAASEAITHERSRSRILDGRITDTGRRSRSLQSGLQPARMYQAWICYRKASARGSSEIAARSPGMVVVGAVVAPTRARSFRLSISRDADREWRLFTLQSPREKSAISVKVGCGAGRAVPAIKAERALSVPKAAARGRRLGGCRLMGRAPSMRPSPN